MLKISFARVALVILLANTVSAANLAYAQQWQVGSSWGTTSDFSIGISQAELWGGSAGAWFSSSGGGLSFQRALSLPPLGLVNSTVQATMRWQGGYSILAKSGAVLGPIALEINSETWQGLPRSDWAYEAGNGNDGINPDWRLASNLAYRVDRHSIVRLGSSWGASGQLSGSYEWRQNIDRNDEILGSLTRQLGGVWQDNLLALTTALSYADAEGPTYSISGLLGLPMQQASTRYKIPLGIKASMYWPTLENIPLLPAESDLNVYAAYEPWRELLPAASPSLRAGIVGNLPLYKGILQLNLSAGNSAKSQDSQLNKFGYRLSALYSLPLGSSQ